MSKFFSKILISLIIIFWALVMSLIWGENMPFAKWFSQKNLSSSVIASTSTSPIPGMSCEKISWNEDGEEIIDFILTSQQSRINTLRFLSSVTYVADKSVQDLHSLLQVGGDITIWQQDYQKRKFHIAYTDDTIVYTQSLFFQGAEYKCPPVELQGEKELSSYTCQDLYAELDSSDRQRVTCTGDQSFTVEQPLWDTTFANVGQKQTILSSLAHTFSPLTFAAPARNPPPTTEEGAKKKNVVLRFLGWTCRFLGKTGKTIVLVGVCPFKICDATLTGLSNQLGKIHPRLGWLFKTASSITIGITTGGSYEIVGMVWGVAERIVVDKNNPAHALMDELLEGANNEEKEGNPFKVIKWTGSQICEVWKKK